MLTAEDIRNVTFSKAIGGFKPEEVDVFLDKVEADYIYYERTINEYINKQEDLIKEIDGFKNSQNSINSVLLSAQRLADQMIAEAKEKSAEIVKEAQANINVIKNHEKELVGNFELMAQQRKSDLEKDLELMIKETQTKCDAMISAAEDAVAKKQIVFNQLKSEIAKFKEDIFVKYKEHMALLDSIPVEDIVDIKESVKSDTFEFDKIEEAKKVVEEFVSQSSGFVVEDFAVKDDLDF